MNLDKFDLDTSIFDFGESDPKWTYRDAVSGVQVFGGVGSGKSSGSGRMLALKYLSNGFGGLILTTKPDENVMYYLFHTNIASPIVQMRQ